MGGCAARHALAKMISRKALNAVLVLISVVHTLRPALANSGREHRRFRDMILMRARYNYEEQDDTGEGQHNVTEGQPIGAQLPLNTERPSCDVDWLKKMFWEL